MTSEGDFLCLYTFVCEPISIKCHGMTNNTVGRVGFCICQGLESVCLWAFLVHEPSVTSTSAKRKKLVLLKQRITSLNATPFVTDF